MRIVVFGPGRRVGVQVDDDVVDLNAAEQLLPANLADFIAGGERFLDVARVTVERAIAGQQEAVHPISTVELHAPTVWRPRIGCAAGNYAEHTLGSARRKGAAATSALDGLAIPDDETAAAQLVERSRERNQPRGFWKDFAVGAGPGDDVVYPDRCTAFDYEGEVVAVLGRPAKDVAPGHGGTYIWGVSLLNDWSIRGKSTRDSHSFNLSKNFDGAASIGPSILVGGDPSDIVVETHVNGELRQRYHSGDMIFSHADYIEYLSRDFTFLPGDMISGGSGPGSGTDSDGRFLKIGDVVEVSSPAIGVLRNCVVAKRPNPATERGAAR
jgi:2-keto-4-pentenoate hydratase/2-oxohepta-3-ene-1,7-dioic acid hydratase in catechol pathway